MKKPLTYEEMRKRDLADFEIALHYLQAALEEKDLAHFMAAFAYVVEAQGGAGKFADKTHLSRQTIYNAMKNKSLRADSLFEIVRGLGLQFELVALEKSASKKKSGSQKVLVAR
jgi:DNA-binding phage protein